MFLTGSFMYQNIQFSAAAADATAAIGEKITKKEWGFSLFRRLYSILGYSALTYTTTEGNRYISYPIRLLSQGLI